MSTPDDLWGSDFDVNDLVPPITILKEQAALLGKKTRQIVTSSVDTEHRGQRFIHTMTIVAPALDNYSYELFTIEHEIELYPAKAYFNNILYICNDVEDLKRALGDILSSNATQKVVKALLAQSK